MATRVPPPVQQARIDYAMQVLAECFSGNMAAFGRALGFTDGSYVGQWKRGGRVIHEATLAEITDLPQVKAKNLIPPPEALQVAHALSLDRAETVPSTTWEQIEMQTTGGATRGVFRMPIDTVEMEPRVKRGTWVQFAGHLIDDAKPGDGILVRDKTDRLHFRVYRAGSPGQWEAHATNENYKPLISDADGLQIIAVLTAVEGRWS